MGRLEGGTSLGLQAEASRLALADAGSSRSRWTPYDLDPYTQAMSMFARPAESASGHEMVSTFAPGSRLEPV